MAMFFALSILLLTFSPLTSGLDSRSTILSTSTFAYPYPSRPIARPTASTVANQTFYWFQTSRLDPNAPTPTLRGRILSTDHFSFTKYRVTCEAKDASLGCTYTDFTVTASGTSQLYYETLSPMLSVGCEVSNTTSAVCSSRKHGQDVTEAVTRTWKASDFPGYYEVIVTPEPVLEGRYEYDQYVYETQVQEPTTTAGGPGRDCQLSWGLLLASIGGAVVIVSITI
ncbi:hypothetical protein TWF481_009435 [Arthrobotrys musiformis]|uniref:AA1-like domain-containing protein n=1 Tax=Arthrobotrys musiformis TaxID=47236 RepID=A0AAV9W3R6_9PEZI